MEKSPLRFIWKYIKIFRWYFIFLFICIVLSTIAGRVYPYYFAKIYDVVSIRAANPNYLGQITTLAFIGLIWGTFKILSFEAANYTAAKTLPKSRTIIYRDVFDYVNRHSINFFNQEMSGRIATKVEQLSSGVQDILDISFRVLMTVIMLVITLALLSYISLYFMAALTVWLALMFYIGLKFGRKNAELSKVAGRSESLAGGVITDSLSNYSEVKSFANSRFEHVNLMKYLKTLQVNEIKSDTRNSIFHGIQQLIAGTSVFGFLFLSIYVLYIGKINAVEFIYANTLFTTMSIAIFDISFTYILLSKKFGKVTSALETLAREPDIIDSPNAQNLQMSQATINFNKVSFGYKQNRHIFRGLNVEIKAGEKVGLVGLSGAGKSTFAKLVARYFDVNAGAITINGIDIRNVTQDSLHRTIATIPQDVCLFNRSLLDNIRYGKVSANAKEVYAAAEKASGRSIHQTLPGGLPNHCRRARRRAVWWRTPADSHCPCHFEKRPDSYL